MAKLEDFFESFVLIRTHASKSKRTLILLFFPAAGHCFPFYLFIVLSQTLGLVSVLTEEFAIEDSGRLMLHL